MGKGIALEFKNRYPEMFKVYQKECDENNFDIGNLLLWKKEDKWVLLFPTKKHWRSKSEIYYIEKGLDKFVQTYEVLGIESIAFPRLGCGNGGLEWNVVQPIMEKHLKNLPIRIYIYVDNYKNTIPEFKQISEMEKWIRENPKSIGFNMLKEDLQNTIKLNNELLICESEIKHISWEEDGIYIINGEEIIIPEYDLSDFWEYIRSVGILETDKLPERFSLYGTIMLDILSRLDYVQPVIVGSNGMDFLKESNGYQYINV
ncbi:macro domain-containing protein [Tissierellaceae bacterium BX21]|uniref:Macro domain-containing protein n=2 Tax=Paratissierella segnis TaxID=2763679 RepID=A0A926IJR8_9FIRM|nr:macro domain-containing protein [Paratissierella segnis]